MMNIDSGSFSEQTLFSSLVSKRCCGFSGRSSSTATNAVDLELDIPDLPDDCRLMRWQIPNTESYEWIDYKALLTERRGETKKKKKKNDGPLDSGIVSDEGAADAVALEKTSMSAVSVWDLALDYELSDYVDWDMEFK